MTSKREFLEKLPLFKNLDGEALDALASLAREYEFERGAVLAYQRDVADKLYIVRRGRLFARTVDERGIVRGTDAYLPGDRFNDVWLFLRQAHDATVKATEGGRVVVIDRDDFLRFVRHYPEAIDDLEPEFDENGEQIAGLVPDAWEEALKVQTGTGDATSRQGALVEYFARRSHWLLVVKELPLIISYLLLMVGFFALKTNLPLFAARMPAIVIPTFLSLFFFSLMIYQVLEWRNDYFIITDSHIIHSEFNLSPGSIGRLVKTTPIDQVQSVEVEKPNLLSTILNVGTVRVTTAAQTGILYFDYIDDPHVVRDTISRLRQLVRDIDAGREQAILRDILEEHFQAGEVITEVAPGDVHGLFDFRQNISFLARLQERYGARVVRGDVVTYRKHPFVLLGYVRFPLALSLLVVAFLFVFNYVYPLQLGVFWIAPIGVGLFGLGWLVWMIEDWRNETFQVTNTYVIDIDRSPFGTGESRKQAPLTNVQNVNADRPGLLPTIFNYGNVYVETAGATADIVFESVMKPSQVQHDIFERREQLRRRQQRQEGERRRKELALMFDVYHQAVEQGRIPRRTPGEPEA
jgi:membrane protein YdbS with pleckstrin-like domain